MPIKTPIQDQIIENLTVPDNAPRPEGYGSVLSNRSFLALWIGQVFSQLADRIVFVVFIALIVKHYGAESADKYNSYLYVAFTIPAILLTAIAGVFVDRWPRRATLVLTNLLRAAFVAGVPLVATGANWLIFAMAFLISAATQFFVPAEAATIPAVVRKTQLLTANSLFTTTMMASVIFGFALGDPLINIFSLSQVHWSIVGLFLLSSISLLFVKIPPSAKEEVKQERAEKTVQSAVDEFLAEIKEGFAYIKEHAMVLNGMLKLAALFATVVSVCILFISFAKVYLYRDPFVAASKFAYIITYCGIGLAFGAFAVGHYFQTIKRGLLVFSGFIVVGLTLALLPMVSEVPRDHYLFMAAAQKLDWLYLDEFHLTWRMVYTYTLSFIMGIGGAFIAIPLQALLHELIPEDIRGKVLGVQFTLLSTCSTLPVLIVGLAVEPFGVDILFLLIGVPLLLLGSIGLFRRIKSRDVFAANW